MQLWHHLLGVVLLAHVATSGTIWPKASWLLAMSVVFSPALADDCFVNAEQFTYCCCGDSSKAECWPSSQVKQMWKVCCEHLASACPENKATATTTAVRAPRAVKATATTTAAPAPRAVKVSAGRKPKAEPIATTTAAPAPRAAKVSAGRKPPAEPIVTTTAAPAPRAVKVSAGRKPTAEPIVTTTAAPAPRAAKVSAGRKPTAEPMATTTVAPAPRAAKVSAGRKPKAEPSAGNYVAVNPASVPSLPLLGGGEIPMSGVGLCCRPSATGNAVRQGVLDFLLLGGRHLDDAKLYNNHKEVGLGIKQALAAGVPRSEIFLTTKIWPSDYGFESATGWVDLVLEELGLDYIDLVLLHTASVPDGLKCKYPRACRQETWLALQRAQADSKILHLGVSNFGARQMGEILALQGSPIEVNQIEYHPWVPTVHLETAKWCQERGIVVTAYGSMGSSGLAAQMMMQDTLKQIGAAHGKTAGQVLLRWAVQKNITVIPGTSNPKHQEENLRIFDFALSGVEMAALDSVPDDQRMLHFGHTPDEKP